MSSGKITMIVPCSGIGKALGTVTREAAYELCEKVRPGDTQIVALSKLVLGDEQARKHVHENRTVTIDGCNKACASKLVQHSEGKILCEISAVEVFRRHPDLKPEGIAELNAEGKALARVMAEEVAAIIDRTTMETSHA